MPDIDRTTLFRRGLLAGGATLGAACATTPCQSAPVATPGRAGDDAELLECCADMEAAQARMDAISGPKRSVQFRTSAEQGKAFEAAHDEWWCALEDAVDLSAKSSEGLCAKARMAQIARNSLQGARCPTMSNFIDSLLTDLLGRAAA